MTLDASFFFVGSSVKIFVAKFASWNVQKGLISTRRRINPVGVGVKVLERMKGDSQNVVGRPNGIDILRVATFIDLSSPVKPNQTTSHVSILRIDDLSSRKQIVIVYPYEIGENGSGSFEPVDEVRGSEPIEWIVAVAGEEESISKMS